MTLRKIIDGLPNGFHDARLFSIRIDIPSKTIDMVIGVWMDTSPVGDEFPEVFRTGRLLLSGVQYLIFDKNAAIDLWAFETDNIWIDILADYKGVKVPKGFIESENSGRIFFNEQSCNWHFNANAVTFDWSE